MLETTKTPGWRAVLAIGIAALLSLPRVDAQSVIISEFMADNGETLVDVDGDSSDWIELVNAGTEAVQLEGWGLTDDSTESSKWSFPALELGVGQFLLVFASGKDRRDPTQQLHTNFKLSQGGEYLALNEPGGTPVSSFSPEYPEQVIDVSYGFPTTTTTTRILEEGAPGRVLVTRSSRDLPDDWNLNDFDDSAWLDVALGIGYDSGATPTFDGLFQTNVGELMEGQNASIFVRIPFQVDDPAAVSLFQLRVLYDSGFVVHLDGVEVARRNADATRVNSKAVSTRLAELASTFEDVPLTLRPGQLRQGTNVLSIQAMNDTSGSERFLFLPLLENVQLASIDTTSPKYFTGTTASGPNPATGRPNLDEISFRPELLPAPGEYVGSVEVSIAADTEFQGEYRVTLDGSVPDLESPLYEGPFQLTETATVRAALFVDGEPVGSDRINTYLVDAEAYDHRVIALAMEPGTFSVLHANGLGVGRPSEREGHIEVFETSGERVAATGMGLRLHGQRGRGGNFDMKKSYKMYFRGIYGEKKLEYPLFADSDLDIDKFDKLVFRANHNDAMKNPGGSLFRDQLVRDLHANMGGVISHGSWYNVLINGQYRGLYNVVERMDSEFLSSYFPDDEEWYVIKTNEEPLDGGEEALDAWREVRDFFLTHDPVDDTHFDTGLTMVDIDNYTSYVLSNIYARNHDWPHNNWYAARPVREGGRWIFLNWDAEFGFPDQRNLSPENLDRTDSWAHLVGGNNQALVRPFFGFLENVRYQRMFLEEFANYLRGPLSDESVLAEIQRLVAILRPDMPEESTLPEPTGGFTIERWDDVIAAMEHFTRGRGAALYHFTISANEFTIPRIERVEPPVVHATGPSEITLHGYSFTESTAVFFDDTPAASVTFVDGNTLRAVIPFDATLTGAPDITVDAGAAGALTSSQLLELTFGEPTGVRFVRGDANGDGRLNLVDALATLGHIFGGERQSCSDALDLDDSGSVRIDDALRLLELIFRSGANPPAPFPNCGEDPTEDQLSCDGQAPC